MLNLDVVQKQHHCDRFSMQVLAHIHSMGLAKCTIMMVQRYMGLTMYVILYLVHHLIHNRRDGSCKGW